VGVKAAVGNIESEFQKLSCLEECMRRDLMTIEKFLIGINAGRRGGVVREFTGRDFQRVMELVVEKFRVPMYIAEFLVDIAYYSNYFEDFVQEVKDADCDDGSGVYGEVGYTHDELKRIWDFIRRECGKSI